MTQRISVCSPLIQQDIVDALRAIPGVDARACKPGDLPRLASEVDGIVILTFHYTPALAKSIADASNRVSWIQLLTAGYDQVEALGVVPTVNVSNAGETWSPAVAEQTMALLLGLSRRMRDCETAQRECRWDNDIRNRVQSLLGARLLIVGFGSIGREVAIRARAFGMRVAGVTRSGRPDPAADAIYSADRLHEALGEADMIVIAAPASRENHHLIGAKELAACRAGSFIVNIARGNLIDSDALMAALRSGHLGGAGLDVTDPEPLPDDHALWTMPNVIIAPHLGGAASPGYYQRMVDHVVANARAFVEGRPLRSVVKVPAYPASASHP